jgi:hypothetical protein
MRVEFDWNKKELISKEHLIKHPLLFNSHFFPTGRLFNFAPAVRNLRKIEFTLVQFYVSWRVTVNSKKTMKINSFEPILKHRCICLLDFFFFYASWKMHSISLLQRIDKLAVLYWLSTYVIATVLYSRFVIVDKLSTITSSTEVLYCRIWMEI